ncbi:MAG: pyridoxal-phosphate dependent enzyme [Pseudomonadota bacterium]|nr:pyridoxal-phosphate dependent enzyme [Pseudomonadota bacterium]
MNKLQLPGISPSLLSLIGNTPLVEVKKIDTGPCRLFLKMESHNPGGSIKDRTALYIIDQAEKDGLLQKDGVIVEATAGNTGIGLALVGILKGYRVILVIPDKMSIEKVAHLRSLGAEVIFTRSDVSNEHPDYYHNVAEKIVSDIPEAFYANQFNNPANIMAHEKTTGPEIWRQMAEQIDTFVAGVGTGGTITGVGRFLKMVSPKTKIVAADPEGSVINDAVNKGSYNYQGGSWFVEGIGEDFVPNNCDLSVVDESISVSDRDAFETIHQLLQQEGILAGSSSGTLVSAAIQWCKSQKEPKRVVTLICDTGNKYLSKAYNEKWLIHNDLINKKPKGNLQDLIAFRADKNQVISVKPEDTLATAYNRMNNSDVSQLPVIEDDLIVGMISEGDLLEYCANNSEGFNLQISSCMQTEINILKVQDSIEDLVDILKLDKTAIILDDKKFIGMITKIDLLAYLKRN